MALLLLLLLLLTRGLLAGSVGCLIARLALAALPVAPSFLTAFLLLMSAVPITITRAAALPITLTQVAAFMTIATRTFLPARAFLGLADDRRSDRGAGAAEQE